MGDANAIPLGQRPQAPPEEEAKPAAQALDPIPDVEWWDARLLRDPQVLGPAWGSCVASTAL